MFERSRIRHSLSLLALILILPMSASAANGIRVGDVSIALGDSKAAVTEAVLASKKHYSLRGGSDDMLIVLDATGSLAAYVRLRKQLVVGIEVLSLATTAADLTNALGEVAKSLIGDTGTLSFTMKPSAKTEMRFSSNNVTIDIRPIPDADIGDHGRVMLFVTLGERDQSIQ